MDCRLPANDIPVTLFRQILIWPMVLAADADTDLADPIALSQAAVTRLTTGGGSKWKRLRDPLTYLDPAPAAAPSQQAYQEFVYFHPFVQRFLYGSARDRQDSPFQIFRRTDLAEIGATIFQGARGRLIQIRLSVQRLHLYVTDTGNVMLVLELSSDDGLARADLPRYDPESDPTAKPERLSLADVQALLNILRRTYPPYWDHNGLAGQCPAEVALHWTDGRGVQRFTMPDPRACARAIDRTRHPPVAQHWAELLAPLTVASACRDAGSCSPVLRHVVDERIPLMALIGVEDPTQIRPGDWYRLAFADDPGAGAYPYGRTFLEGLGARHFYDRFWDPEKGFATRYVQSGYCFAMVGQDNGFYRGVLLEHFRRHYFQMRLILHFHHATLLTLSDRLSQAIDRHGRDRKLRHLRRAVHAVQLDILCFTHRYWFESVSNHVQPQELFEAWRAEVGTKRLFDQLNREAAESDRFLQTEEQAEQTKAAHRLNRVGAGVAGFVLTTGLLGMNLLVPARDAQTGLVPDPAAWWSNADLGEELVYFGGALGLSFGLLIVIYLLVRSPEPLGAWLRRRFPLWQRLR